MDLFGGDLDAIDGSKFKAVNNKGRNFTERKLPVLARPGKRAMKDIEKKIDPHLDELDENDANEPDEHKPTAEELKEKIKRVKERMKEYKGIKKRMEDTGETQISLTDADNRSMPLAGGPRTQVGYNVQVSVDEKHKLIVDHKVTNDVTDRSLLSRMAKRAKEILGWMTLKCWLTWVIKTGSKCKIVLKRASCPTSPKRRLLCKQLLP